jgi:hypothetical protein
VSPEREDDREAVDRAFAELVAGYHLTAEPPHPQPAAPAEATQGAEADESWADHHPLFLLQPTPVEPAAVEPAPSEPAPEPAADRPYVPEPLPPMSRPGLPVLVGWIGIGYAVLLVLAATFGLRFPMWADWLAVGSFLGGFGVLVSQLPRHRPPDAGDGAVL